MTATATTAEGASRHRLRALVLGCVLGWTVVVSYFAVAAHLDLQTQMNDLGNADQALWRAAGGDLLMTQSNDVLGQIRSRFGMHVNLAFWPLSLVYHLWPDPRALLVLSVLSCGAAAWGLYALGTRWLGCTWWSAVAPLAFLASPLVQDAALYDFHVITVATALLVWSVVAFERNRSALGYVLLLLMLSCKEDLAVIGVVLGFCYWSRGQRRRGTTIAGLSTAYLVIVVLLIAPLLDTSDLPQAVAGRYEWLRAGLGDVVRTLLRPDRLRLPLYLALAGAAVAWRGWRWLLLALPHLGLAMAAGTLWTTRLTGTYYWVLTAAAICIAAMASARTADDADPVRPRPLAALLILTLVVSVLFSPLPYGTGAWIGNYRVDPGISRLRQIAAQIPVGDALSVQNNLGPHLSQRPDVATFPRRSRTADWLLFHLRYQSGPSSGLFVRTTPNFLFGTDPENLADTVVRAVRSDQWGLVAAVDGFYLFRRGAPDALPTGSALLQVEQDRLILLQQYRAAVERLSPLAGVAVGRLAWDDVLQGELLRPGHLPGDPVELRERVPLDGVRR